MRKAFFRLFSPLHSAPLRKLLINTPEAEPFFSGAVLKDRTMNNIKLLHKRQKHSNLTGR
jgi:hypothetical protein